MIRSTIFFLLLTPFCFAQKLKKGDKLTLQNLQTHIRYLASDKLEGRRTGSEGEKLAYTYISNEFKKNGLLPKGSNSTFIQPFEVNEGKQIDKSTHVIINGNDLIIEKDFYPLIYSANKSVEAAKSINTKDAQNVWFFNVGKLLEENKNNPHFDVVDAVKTKAKDAAQQGASAFIIFNKSNIDDNIKFEAKAKDELLTIPIIYLTKNIAEKYCGDENAVLDLKIKISITEKKRTGNNVIGYIDNAAPLTIIIGAHYDHLGYGEDANSLYTGIKPQIHNGADDNASGTAAMIELSRIIKSSNLKKYNFVFIAFSGEELGLYGSKFFSESNVVNFSQVNYMINLDMVGRLSDSTHGLNIGGYGTSPTWGELLKAKDNYFTIKFDSSGTGPSDHTSFYRKDVPVLFFFTGVHSDYHKPTDDAEKINYMGELKVIQYIYDIVEATNKKEKLVFTKTREVSSNAKSSFKVTLGIMPDYTYSGSGVRVDGVSEGKLAQKTGILTGDVLQQLGDYKFNDVEGYMQALGKFKKGDATTVKVKRADKDLNFEIVF